MSRHALLYAVCLGLAAWCAIAAIILLVIGDYTAAAHAAQLGALALLCADRVTLHARCDRLDHVTGAWRTALPHHHGDT